MELNFYEVRVGTRSRSGNLNVLYSFVCKTEETREYKVQEFYLSKYQGFNVDVIKVNEIVELSKKDIKNDYSFEVKSTEQARIKELEQENKKLLESKNTVFIMEMSSDSLNEENSSIYKEMMEQYNIYKGLVKKLEKLIINQILDKYKPFAKNVYVDESIMGTRSKMKFRLELKDKLI